jgi:UDP-N-acetyl-D-glucosamine/UDP-N-acetyl-D-galactosamine dehydrogenase
MSFDINNIRISIVSLGYVGLPLALEFGNKYSTLGFDIKADRITDREGGVDSTLERSSEELAEAEQLSFTSDGAKFSYCNFYIVTVRFLSVLAIDRC